MGSPKELANRMAAIARMVRDLIAETFRIEGEKGPFQGQLEAFREVLIADLKPEQFADMYAQTIAYGLFAARCNHEAARPFTRQDAAFELPKTNPFLRKLFGEIAGPGLDERIAWAVDDLAGLLSRADMDAVLQGFGRRGAREDPVVHFYETFLAAYDPKMRKVRGIYYTPGPVVSYIVRSIDHLLKTSFGRPRGLADTNILILDTACGTGTFLYSAIDLIYEALKDQRGAWSGYVEKHLLPRIFGFELLMAPYAVSHMKLGLQLKATGYDFKGDERLGIYLTNTLEEAKKRSEAMFAQWIADKANAASEIKRDKPIMIVLGNPPYFGHSANMGPWIKGLIEDYKKVDGEPLGEKNPKWLQDDYVKFIRFGQWRIERTGLGILAFITNHGYLDNPTFRGMRQNLIDTFTDIYIINLHGSSKKKEKTPEGGKDENIFDIQLGVAISIFVKKPGKTAPANVHYAELWGLREAKYSTLAERDVSSTKWTEINFAQPFYLLVPQDAGLLPEYEKGWKITDIFKIYSTGIKTHRDHFVIDFDEDVLRRRIASFLDETKSDDEVRQRFNLKDNRDWKLKDKRKAIQEDKNWQDKFNQCLYRPFDFRPIFYHKDAIDFTRPEVMRNMLIANLAMLTCRQ